MSKEKAKERRNLDIEETDKILNILRKSKLTEEYLNNLSLTEREKEIIQFLKEKKRITSADVQKKYEVSRDTANRWLNKLLGLNLIERKGRGKAVYYILKEK